LQIKTKIVSCHTADSKQVKQEVNRTVILSPFSIPWPVSHNASATDSLSNFQGYGHIIPTTTAGKMFCIGYALIGIPLLLGPML
jgi:hypothetical protein